MTYTLNMTEYLRPVTKIDPASYTTEQNTARVSMANYRRLLFILFVGAIAGSGTLDADVEQHNAASGGTTKNVTGKSITQLTTADDNKLVAIELRQDQLDVNNGFNWVSLELTPATAAAIVGVLVLAGDPADLPIGVTEWDEVK